MYVFVDAKFHPTPCEVEMALNLNNTTPRQPHQEGPVASSKPHFFGDTACRIFNTTDHRQSDVDHCGCKDLAAVGSGQPGKLFRESFGRVQALVGGLKGFSQGVER